MLNTDCRCGTENVVIPGGYTMCPHCDRPCMTNGCQSCAAVRRTCNDCRTVFKGESARATCEAAHEHDR